MPEETQPDSLSDATLRTPGAVDAFDRGQDYTDRDVFDANGMRLGRVTKCFMEGGRLVSCEVNVDDNLKRELHTRADSARFPPDAIANVDERGIRLMKAAAQVLPDVHAREGDTGAGGSDSFPRSER